MSILLDHLAKTWHIEVLYSIPATFIYFSFSFVFFGHAFHQFWKKLIILVLIQCWFVGSLVIYVPGYIQELDTLLSLFILFFIFFRGLSLVNKIRIPLFMFVLMVITEMVGSLLTLILTGQSELTKPINLIFAGWPIFISISILTYRMNKRKTKIGLLFYQSIMQNKPIFYLCLILIFQLIALAGIASSTMNKKSNILVLNFLSILSISFSLLIIYLIINIYSKIKSQVFHKTEEMYIEQINNLFTSIKSQRHDFLNNAQVMIAMLYRQDKEGLQKYLNEYMSELHDLSEIMVINEPAISALIQTKKIYAEQHKILFTFKFSDLEKINLGIKIIDIVKILGNLIDNAFDEVIQISEDQRKVHIICWIEAKTLCITVCNPLKEIIIHEQIAQMFQANYTSKQNGHTGLGLAIIKQKADQLKGEITASLEDNTITFNLRLPLKNNEMKS